MPVEEGDHLAFAGARESLESVAVEGIFGVRGQWWVDVDEGVEGIERSLDYMYTHNGLISFKALATQTIH